MSCVSDNPVYRAEAETVLAVMNELASGAREPIDDEETLRLAVEERHTSRREKE
jgi:hypothetical protein